MNKLFTIKNRVRDVLERHKEARDDDMVLYLLVCQDGFRNVPLIADLSFEFVLTHFAQLGCPRFESVRRARQKVQSESPELGCSPEVRRRRNQTRADYIITYSRLRKVVR